MFLSRGERDLGVAFQTHPGRQASISSGSKEPRSALESRRVSLAAASAATRRSPFPGCSPALRPTLGEGSAHLSVRLFFLLSSFVALFLPASWRFPCWPSLLR